MKRFLFHTFWGLIIVGCNNTSVSKIDSDKKSQSASPKTIIDLSHPFSESTVYWVTAEEFTLDTVFNGMSDKGYFYAANNFKAAEHGGTHLDAPIHFYKDGQTVDKIPLEHLIGTAIKIDVSSQALKNPDYLLSTEDLKAWETKHQTSIPDNSIVLLQTGHSRYYPDKLKYLGTSQRGDAAVKDLHFPGLSPDAAQWLVDKRHIKAIGIDTPSIDYGQSVYFKSHVILLSQQIPVFENLTNLNHLPNRGFEVIALPMKIEGGSGAPLRIIALVN